MDYQIGDYIISEKTLATHFKTKKDKSKKPEWYIADVPSLITKITDDSITLQQFTSAKDRKYIIGKENFKFFKKCHIEDGFICGLKWYPEGKIKLTEFKERENVDKFKNNVKNLIKNLPEVEPIRKILKGKFFQLYTPQGAKCDEIPVILNYDLEELRKHPTKRINNMIFNRCSRWTPPIPSSYSYEEYEKSINFTRPIGTRPKDFCWPSELIDTMKEMIRQIICFKNIDPDVKQQIIQTLELNTVECQEIHKCKWSGEKIDALKFSSGYASKDNFIEICHRDPNERFISSNMYWGFGESNRQQGGYSETNRVKQIAILMNYNPDHIKTFISTLNPQTIDLFKNLLQ